MMQRHRLLVRTTLFEQSQTFEVAHRGVQKLADGLPDKRHVAEMRLEWKWRSRAQDVFAVAVVYL